MAAVFFYIINVNCKSESWVCSLAYYLLSIDYDILCSFEAGSRVLAVGADILGRQERQKTRPLNELAWLDAHVH